MAKRKNILAPKPRSRYLKVQCSECNNEQIVFGSSTTTINCSVCGKQLLQTTGGKARILTKISDLLS
jgi:small subunit ribosomal protein S27e